MMIRRLGNRPRKITGMIMGAYAALLAILHGVFELMQGPQKPAQFLINAMGPPCQPEEVWHACFPALSLMPTYALSGIITLLIAGLLLVLSFSRLKHPINSWGQIILAMNLLPIGGGFVPVWIGILAGIATLSSTRDEINLEINQTSDLTVLEIIWLISLLVFILWFPASWLLGYFIGTALLKYGSMLFFVFDIGLPLLILFTGIFGKRQAF